MVWAGAPYAHELNFGTGLPTGAVIYSVLGNDGLALSGLEDVSINIPPGVVSYLLVIPGSAHTVSTPLFEARTLVWSYPTATGIAFDRFAYRVEKPMPFPATADGVRGKLGVQPKELLDRDIDLMLAYGNFAARFDSGALDAYENSGDYNNLLIVNAIEATAALMALPSLQLAVAKAESSGTNEFERFAKIDWELLAQGLNDQISQAVDLVVPVDETVGGTIFFTVQRPDPLTGES